MGRRATATGNRETLRPRAERGQWRRLLAAYLAADLCHPSLVNDNGQGALCKIQLALRHENSGEFLSLPLFIPRAHCQT